MTILFFLFFGYLLSDRGGHIEHSVLGNGAVVHGSLRFLAEHLLCCDEGGGREPGHLLRKEVRPGQGAQDRQRGAAGKIVIIYVYKYIHPHTIHIYTFIHTYTVHHFPNAIVFFCLFPITFYFSPKI